MPDPRTPRSLAVAVVAAVIALSLTASSAPALAAQEPAAGAATTGAVATPFLGSFPVWCTDGNPAPGAICATHHGSPAIDIGMDPGVAIRAAGAGTVLDVESGCDVAFCRGGAGNFVAIGHFDGTSSRYLHLSETLVDKDDVVSPGQVIGISGASGQTSAAHLHYDEHFPAGSRTPFGPWLACVDGLVVQYPDALGFSAWEDVPFGSVITNDGYECLVGVGLGAPLPLIYAGAGVLGVAAPPTIIGTRVELELTAVVGQVDTTTSHSLTRTHLTRIATADSTSYRLRIRSLIGSVWSDWSDTVEHDPAEFADSTTCWGLHASSDAGTAAVDVLIGSGGDDSFEGGTGDDIICGNGGDDLLIGGSGNDLIDGGKGDDTIRGDDGNDRLFGRLGRDEIDGGQGRDRVVGGSGADQLFGGSGPDVVLGGSANDTVRGSGGNDRLVGGRGDDAIFGGAGSDRLFGSVGLDALDGGQGVDRCSDDDPGSDLRKCEA